MNAARPPEPDGVRIVVRIAAPAWRRAVPGVSAKVKRWAAAAAAAAGRGAAGEIAVVLADDRTLHRLNRTFRGKDKPTNVLSFPAGAPVAGLGADQPLGDVAIALGIARAEAAAGGRALADHLAHLTIHGVLHLLGHDHQRAAAAKRMEGLETRILAGFAIADPYAPARRRA